MIEILHRVTGAVLYRAYVPTVVAAAEAAVKTGVSLAKANLAGANLSRSNLKGANLEGADLIGADLAGANLAEANLDKTREDFYAVLALARAQVPALWKALLDGKVDGSVYEKGCVCLIGKIDSTRAAERWFLAIRRGDTPDNSVVSRLTVEWLREYAERESIVLPSRRVVWSDAEPVS